MALLQLWTRLDAVSTLEFHAQSQSNTGWSGAGSGAVKIEHPDENTLIFRESGFWRQLGGKEIRFSNVFRWSGLAQSRVRLEHLRFGANQPVFLFDLAPDENGIWRDVAPHVCRADFYSATLQLEESRIVLDWSVKGPTRNEQIRYFYLTKPAILPL